MIQHSWPASHRLLRQVGGPDRVPVFALAATVFLAACNPFIASRPGTIVDPDVSGVVTQATLVPGSQTSYRLDVGGREITIDTHRTEKLYNGFPKGGVVLYGTKPRPWYLGTYADDDGCYLIVNGPAFDDPEAVILAFSQLGGVGIRIPKAPGFDPGTELVRTGPDAGQYISTGHPGFCLDAQGRMARALGGPPQPTPSP